MPSEGVPGGLASRVALAAVLTGGVLEEFELLRYSFELFHGSGFEWFVRCDLTAAEALSEFDNVHCNVSLENQAERVELDDARFRGIAGQKMLAIQDAWEYNGKWDAVMFLDSDLVIASHFLPLALETEGNLILTPHYYSPQRVDWAKKYGYFNSGFLLTLTPAFHTWWQHAFVSQPWQFTDQQCLDDAPKTFKVGVLGEQANISYWRGAPPLELPPIPPDCMFFHVHMFQPGHTASELVWKILRNELGAALGKEQHQVPFGTYQLLHKAFALHCLAFLKTSRVEKHNVLFREILSRDSLGLYSRILGS